jgi:hypothetical protein
MTIGSVGNSSTIASLTTPRQPQTPLATAGKPVEEVTESAQERAKETGKGENIDIQA